MAKMPPKLGRRSRASHWISRAHTLSDSARLKLTEAVGLSSADDNTARLETMCMKVQHALGAYYGAIQAVDNAPRASDYVREYARLEHDAKGFLEDLAASSERIKEDLEAELATVHATDLHAIERSIRLLAAALKARARIYAAESEDGGRPRSLAIKILIDPLRSIFADCYSKDVERRPRRRGAIKAISPQEADELAFIRVAISDAGIRLDNEKLKRLLRRRRQGK